MSAQGHLASGCPRNVLASPICLSLEQRARFRPRRGPSPNRIERGENINVAEATRSNGGRSEPDGVLASPPGPPPIRHRPLSSERRPPRACMSTAIAGRWATACHALASLFTGFARPAGLSFIGAPSGQPRTRSNRESRSIAGSQRFRVRRARKATRCGSCVIGTQGHLSLGRPRNVLPLPICRLS